MTEANCPNCGESIHITTGDNEYFKCKHCKRRLIAYRGIVVPASDYSVGSYTPTTKPKRAWKLPNSYRTQAAEATPVKWNKILHWGLALLLLFGIIGGGIYAWEQQENWAFTALKKNPRLHKMNMFLWEYPETKYRDRVLVMMDSLWYMQAKAQFEKNLERKVCNCEELGRLLATKPKYEVEQIKATYEDCLWKKAELHPSFAAIEDYTKQFPKGRYKAALAPVKQQLKEELMEKLQQNYALRISRKDIRENARQYIEGLIKQIGKEDTHKIYIAFEATHTLKDWGDYPKRVHTMLDEAFEQTYKEEEKDFPLPSKSPPPSIKSALDKYSASLEVLFMRSLQICLDSLLAPNPYSIFRGNTMEDVQAATIHVQYDVETLTYPSAAEEIPLLYTMTRRSYFLNGDKGNSQDAEEISQRRNGIAASEALFARNPALRGLLDKQEQAIVRTGTTFEGYSLATAVHWSVDFKAPYAEGENNYSLSAKSRPQAYFENPRTQDDTYHRMLTSAFQSFGQEVALQLGL